jgi:hypothetical protein
MEDHFQTMNGLKKEQAENVGWGTEYENPYIPTGTHMLNHFLQSLTPCNLPSTL